MVFDLLYKTCKNYCTYLSLLNYLSSFSSRHIFEKICTFSTLKSMRLLTLPILHRYSNISPDYPLVSLPPNSVYPFSVPLYAYPRLLGPIYNAILLLFWFMFLPDWYLLRLKFVAWPWTFLLSTKLLNYRLHLSVC